MCPRHGKCACQHNTSHDSTHKEKGIEEGDGGGGQLMEWPNLPGIGVLRIALIWKFMQLV